MYGEETDDIITTFDRLAYRNVTDGQTDRRTDGGQAGRITISISRASVLTRDKNTTNDWILL